MNKQELASRIWESANNMRSKIEANEYKDYILTRMNLVMRGIIKDLFDEYGRKGSYIIYRIRSDEWDGGMERGDLKPW